MRIYFSNFLNAVSGTASAGVPVDIEGYYSELINGCNTKFQPFHRAIFYSTNNGNAAPECTLVVQYYGSEDDKLQSKNLTGNVIFSGSSCEDIRQKFLNQALENLTK